MSTTPSPTSGPPAPTSGPPAPTPTPSAPLAQPTPPTPATPPPVPADGRPDGVSEAEWSALADPGRQALQREREARQAAERALAAARSAQPTPPQPTPAQPATPDAPDIAAIVQAAVAEAVKPFAEAEQQRQAAAAAATLADAVTTAARDVLHDPTDALAAIDLSALTDDSGGPDQAKITAAIAELAKAKPHLVRDPRRVAPPSAGSTPGGGVPPLDDQIKAARDRMLAATGIKPAG